MTSSRTLASALAAATMLSSFAAPFAAHAQTAAPLPAQPAPLANPNAKADADQKKVLDALQTLGAKGVEELTVAQARAQPTPADAVKKVLGDMGKPTTPVPALATKEVKYPAGKGQQPARIYLAPKGAANPPVILYFHGGGWVIADINVYDAGARALARETGAIVVSAEYRHAPEDKFPAAHDDANAAYKWVLANAKRWGGDPRRVAVAGESAGGNLALNVAIAARDKGWQAPVHVLAVYPVGGTDTNTPSYVANSDAKPLSRAGILWFVKNTTRSADQLADPRLDIIGHARLDKLPPVTIINAEIDPLRSDGELLAAKIKAAGGRATQTTYSGVAHEFLGQDAVVAKARTAQSQAGRELRASFDAANSAKR